MKKNLKVLGVMAVLAATVVGFSSCSGGEKAYKIGVSGPLTGGAAVYGLAVQNAASMAVEEINKAGGVNGNKFKFTALDDTLEADKAKTNYNTLFEGGMQLSLGCVTSGACLEFAKVAKDDGVFCLTPSATNDGVPAVGDNTYQMCFSDSGQGTAAANYIKTNYPEAKVGVFYDSSEAYSKGIYDNFKAQYTNTVDAAFTSDSKTTFTSQITALKDCDFIFMPIYYTEASIFIEQAKDTFGANVVYFGCDGLDGIDAVEGFDVNKYKQEISYLSHFNAGATDAATTSFVANYKAKYGEKTLNQFGAAAYDCIYAYKKAIETAVANGKEVPVNIKAKAMGDIMKEVFTNGFTFSGVTGTNITWNADGTVSKAPTKYVVNPNRAK